MKYYIQNEQFSLVPAEGKHFFPEPFLVFVMLLIFFWFNVFDMQQLQLPDWNQQEAPSAVDPSTLFKMFLKLKQNAGKLKV